MNSIDLRKGGVLCWGHLAERFDHSRCGAAELRGAFGGEGVGRGPVEEDGLDHGAPELDLVVVRDDLGFPNGSETVHGFP